MATRIFGMCLGLAVAGLYAQDKSTDLPLKFEKGKSYTFQVQAQNWGHAGMHAQEGSSKSSGTATGSEQPSSQSNKSDQSSQSDQGSRSSSSGMSGETGSSSEMARSHNFEYRIQVQDTSSDKTTLNVDINRMSASSAMGTGTSTESQPSSQTAGAAAATGGRQPLGTLVVTVDKDGAIKEIKGWENLRWNKGSEKSGAQGSSTQGSQGSSSSAQGSRSSDEGTTRGATSEAGASGSFETQHPFIAKMVRNQLEVILGGGLHQKKLDVGRYYYLRTQSGVGASSSQPSSSSSSEQSRSGQSSSSGTSGYEGGASASGQVGGTGGSASVGAGLQNPLNTVLYRFEGTTKQGDKEMARFTVMVPEAAAAKAMGKSSTGQSDQNKSGRPSSGQSEQGGQSAQKGQGGEMSDQALAQAGWKRVGEATYSTDDGLLHNFNADLAKGAAGFSSPETSTGPSITIRRVEAGAASSSATGSSSSSSGSSSSSDKDKDKDKDSDQNR